MRNRLWIIASALCLAAACTLVQPPPQSGSAEGPSYAVEKAKTRDLERQSHSYLGMAQHLRSENAKLTTRVKDLEAQVDSLQKQLDVVRSGQTGAYIPPTAAKPSKAYIGYEGEREEEPSPFKPSPMTTAP